MKYTLVVDEFVSTMASNRHGTTITGWATLYADVLPHGGEVWLCRHGQKVRPVIVMSREQVHERLAKITVVPVSSTDRGWPDGVRFTAGEAGSALITGSTQANLTAEGGR